jgi:hypothetical protein
LANANGRDRGADVRHGVVDCEAGGNGSARRVYVEGYGFFWGVGFEVEELGDDGCGDGFVYFAVEADDAFLEQFGEYVGLEWLVGGSQLSRRRVFTGPPTASLVS